MLRAGTITQRIYNNEGILHVTEFGHNHECAPVPISAKQYSIQAAADGSTWEKNSYTVSYNYYAGNVWQNFPILQGISIA